MILATIAAQLEVFAFRHSFAHASQFNCERSLVRISIAASLQKNFQ